MTNLMNSLDSDHFDLTESLIDSTCSELERLEPESREDTPAERAIANTRKEEDRALKLIQEAQALGANTLDLSNKGLLQIPDELLRLQNLEYLYLEGNRLSFLPDDFFEKLSNLVWLDLRNNRLSRLPTVHLKRHTRLRNLLLEKNKIRSLPLELGAVKTLNGLNISNNPLEFPPETILEKGTHEILKFLRDMMAIKANGQLSHRNGDSGKVSSEEDEGGIGDKAQRLPRRRRLPSRSLSQEAKVETDLIGPVLQTAELHRPASYSEMKEQQNQKLKKLGALGSSGRKKSSTSVMSWKVNPYPEPPTADIAERRMAQERRDAKQKELVEKQEAILQRRKDEATLKEWRDETKRLQQKKYYESLVKGTKDFIDTAAHAPFGVDEAHLKMMNNEERLREDTQSTKPRPISPATKQRMEMEKTLRIQELERRIKEHTASMVARRKKPKGTPQEEMEAARRELEIAEDLHQELATRRKDLEYRFQAFC